MICPYLNLHLKYISIYMGSCQNVFSQKRTKTLFTGGPLLADDVCNMVDQRAEIFIFTFYVLNVNFVERI